MLAIVESILPIFLLIIVGNLLRRLPIIDRAAWPGLEQIGYWFLYPVLLFVTIYNADFSGLQLDAMLAALLASVAILGLGTLSLWPLLRASGAVAATEFSSVFQTSVRWNGFMAFAVAEKVFPPEGAAVVALAMAVIIVPINVESVFVVTRFGDREADWPNILRAVAKNPLILGSLAAVLLRFAPFDLYEPVNEALGLVGRAALGMGLVVIGAGLRPGDMLRPRLALWVPVVIKLALAPAIVVVLGLMLRVSGQQLAYLALCGAVPTAMNGYLLARQLGGDAELYAAITTLQTVVSFASIPAVLAITAQFIAG